MLLLQLWLDDPLEYGETIGRGAVPLGPGSIGPGPDFPAKKEFLLTSPFSKRSIERKPLAFKFVPGHNPGVCFKIFVPADYSHMVLKYFVFFLKRNAAT